MKSLDVFPDLQYNSERNTLILKVSRDKRFSLPNQVRGYHRLECLETEYKRDERTLGEEWEVDTLGKMKFYTE